jgi:hypothetical protein
LSWRATGRTESRPHDADEHIDVAHLAVDHILGILAHVRPGGRLVTNRIHDREARSRFLSVSMSLGRDTPTSKRRLRLTWIGHVLIRS